MGTAVHLNGRWIVVMLDCLCWMYAWDAINDDSTGFPAAVILWLR